jgi:hypothetical protein
VGLEEGLGPANYPTLASQHFRSTTESLRRVPRYQLHRQKRLHWHFLAFATIHQ